MSVSSAIKVNIDKPTSWCSIFSVQKVNDNNDKGQRWTFYNTKLYNQARGSKKYVGYDDSKMEFSASYGEDDGDNLVEVKENGNKKAFCRGTECIGAGGGGKYLPSRIYSVKSILTEPTHLKSPRHSGGILRGSKKHEGPTRRNVPTLEMNR